MNPLTNGTYQLADPLQEWKVLETIREATDHRKVDIFKSLEKIEFAKTNQNLAKENQLNQKCHCLLIV